MKMLLIFLFVCLSCIPGSHAQQYGIYHDERDNKTYQTVQIGSQLWMAENLNFETETGSWCYDESNAHCLKFGRLYSFETAKIACMDEWRLPSKEDYDVLLKYASEADITLHALKEGGSIGFNAIPGGWRGEYSGSYYLGEQARFWSSTTKNVLNAWFFSLDFSQNHATMQYESRELGLSVRCVKDKSTKTEVKK
jgi:uncharacterized protein (TIGR02145 family)